jgi:ribosomal protein L22
MADEKNDKNAAKDEAAKKPAKKAAAKKETAAKAESKSESKKGAKKDAPAKKDGPKAESKKDAKSESKASKKAAKKEAKGNQDKKTAKKEPAKRPKAKAPAAPPVVRARARYVRVAPRKARLVADQVRGLHIEQALALLQFSPRGAAQDIQKLIQSAAANAENNHDLVGDEMRVASITVDEGPTLRRFRPRALGRATPINKRTSHIAVALTPAEDD